ncbi:MAG: hypothetical protein VW576_01225 [Opitutae bacterium]
MPIYEFYSPKTNKIYSFYSRRLTKTDEIPHCPDGKDFEMQKLISGFSITGSNANDENLQDDFEEGKELDPFSRLNENQSAQVMREMERAMSGMDDENPDPRQMGALMRRMCEMTGEKMDGVMEEVVRKLEEGANPEELEERMDGVMEDQDDGQGTMENSSVHSHLQKIRKRFLTRDPELYEMNDFLP